MDVSPARVGAAAPWLLGQGLEVIRYFGESKAGGGGGCLGVMLSHVLAHQASPGTSHGSRETTR